MVIKLQRTAGLVACTLLLLASALGADDFSEAAGYYQSGQWQPAIAAWDAFIASHPDDSRRIEAEFFRAESLTQAGRHADAVVAFGSFLKQHAGHAFASRARYRKAEAYYLDGRYVAAARAFREFHNNHPYHGLQEFSLTYLGLSLLQTGNADSARDAFLRSIDRFPNGQRSFAARRSLIQLAANAGDAPAMQSMLIAAQPHLSPQQRAEWHFWNGDRLIIAGDRTGGRDELQLARRASPAASLDRQIIMRLVEVERQLGNVEAARTLTQEVVERWPESEAAEAAMLKQLELAIEERDYDAALGLHAEFQKRYPESRHQRDASRMKAQCLIKQERYAAALEILLPLSRNTSGAQVSVTERNIVWYHLAVAEQGVGNSKRALEILNRIRLEKIAPTFRARVEFGKATALESLQRYEEAEQALDSAEAIPGENLAFRSRLKSKRIVLLINTGEIDEAVSLLNEWQVSGRNEWYERAVDAVAVSAERRGELATAEETYRRALAKTKPSTTILAGLVRNQLALGRWDDATQTLATLHRSFPTHDVTEWATIEYARECEASGNGELAVQSYRSLISRSPKLEWKPALHAAGLLARQGFAAESLALLDKTRIDLDDSSAIRQVDYQRAWLSDRLGRTVDAETIYRELQQATPRDALWQDVTYRLAMNAARKEQIKESQRLIDELVESLLGAPNAKLRPYVLYLRAQLAAKRGEWETVIHSLDQVLVETEHELSVAARLLAGEALYQIREYDNAQYRLAPLLENESLTDAQRDWVRVRIAQVLGVQGQWGQALTTVESVIVDSKQTKWRADAYLVAGRALIATGHPLKGMELLKRLAGDADASRATRAAARWNIGNVYFQTANYDEAISQFASITIDDSTEWFARANLRMGKCYERTGRIESAMHAYERLSFMDESPYRADALERLRMLAAERFDATTEPRPVSVEGPGNQPTDAELDTEREPVPQP